MTVFERGYLTKEIPPRMTFALPISFFKSISIIFGGDGLIFEGLTNRVEYRNEKFCQGLPGVPACHASGSVVTAVANCME